ncbi:MAG: type II secretion system secretin GspD [Deltaproteobacteria bacterium]|nr:type II secretion system secretin GspD [Deltaproteobacteria bacterium]
MASKIINKFRWVLIFVMFFCLTTVVHGQKAERAGSRKNSNKTISMDFDQVDIKVFIKFISELTGKNFVIDDKVRGKVTVLSPSKISVEEAYKVFESVLEVNGYTTVPAGKVIKIVPSVEARQKSVELRKTPVFVPRADDRIITQIIPLQFAEAQEVRKLLAPLVSKQGVIIAYDPTDSLIITDYQSNIQRLLHIVNEIDVEFQDATISVIPLEYASSESLATTISGLLETRQKQVRGRRAGPPLKVLSYDRINMLIVLADRQNTQMIQALVKTLDQPTPKGAGNVQVVYLENAQAEDLAKVLTGLPAKPQAKGEQPVISTEVKIVADKATNALVITAKPEEYQVLQPIIQQLDIPRKQVYVEALIMEVRATLQISVGVDWVTADKTNLPLGLNEGVVFGGSRTAGASVLDATGNLALPTGLTAGVVSFPVTIGGITFTNLAALITASQTDNDINVISTPQLMTLDNEEASVVVAENIPFSTRVDEGTAVTDRAIQSFEYRDVGVTLKVTPQINEKRFVKLKIYEEISRVVSQTTQISPTQAVLAPTTTKRTAETNVQVKDGETVVIAGLVGDNVDITSTKVPCLGDIPLVGWLFKSERRDTTRTNLLIFLTPYIVVSSHEADEIYHRKSKMMEKVKEGYGPAEKTMEEPAPSSEQTPINSPSTNSEQPAEGSKQPAVDSPSTSSGQAGSR